MSKNSKVILDDIQSLKKELMTNVDGIISRLDSYNRKNIKQNEKEEIKNILDKIDSNL